MEITVVIVSYKSEHLIFKNIEKFNKNTQILVIENAEDKLLKKQIEKRYRNVKVILNKNSGFGQAANLGAKLSKTKYIFFCSPDNIISNNCFQKLEKISKDLNDKFSLLVLSNQKDDLLHKGTVRSGDRISSNGNLCIIGDVNPGAIVTAKKNIYVWGKLLGIAFAGKGGDKNTSISSLYLNPLQLRIADVIAIGPNTKPTNYYPEIAVIDNQTITINPYIIETKN